MEKGKYYLYFCLTSRRGRYQKIMSELFLEKKIVVVPKVLKERILELFQIKSADDLSVGKFGVLEPKSHCKAVDKNQ